MDGAGPGRGGPCGAVACGLRRQALVLLVGLPLDFVTFLTADALVDGPRPGFTTGPVPSTSTFPSGHAAVAVPAAVSASRVYEGLHHPTDVVAGMCLGAASLAVAVALARRVGAPAPSPGPGDRAPTAGVGGADGVRRSPSRTPGARGEPAAGQHHLHPSPGSGQPSSLGLGGCCVTGHPPAYRAGHDVASVTARGSDPAVGRGSKGAGSTPPSDRRLTRANRRGLSR